MKKISVITALAAVAAVNPEGYTVNAQTLEPITNGYAVALKSTQNSFGAEGMKKVVNEIAKAQELAKVFPEILNGRTLAFGGWRDSETGLYYFDATIVVASKLEALELGRINKQLAIFDLNNMEEVRL